MSRETQSRQIGNVTFKVTQLGFARARAVFARLSKLLGGALATLAKGGDALTLEGAAPVIAMLCEGLTEAELKFFCDEFASFTVIEMSDGKEANFGADAQELVFGGHIERMFLWLRFCLEVNFGSFFAEAGMALGVKAVPAAG